MATYETFASVYDAIMDDSLYEKWTDFSLRHFPKDKKKLLELACGTGIQSIYFKQAGFACAIVSHQADAIVGVDFQLFDIQDIAAGIFQKDVFSFDYEFHRLNRLLCISVLLEAQPCQKRLLTSIFRLCPIAGASVLTLRKPANPKMIVGDE